VPCGETKIRHAAVIRIARSGALFNDQLQRGTKLSCQLRPALPRSRILARGGLASASSAEGGQNIWRVRDGLSRRQAIWQVFEPNSRMVCNILILGSPSAGSHAATNCYRWGTDGIDYSVSKSPSSLQIFGSDCASTRKYSEQAEDFFTIVIEQL